MTRLLGLLTVLVLAIGPAAAVEAGAADRESASAVGVSERKVPTREQWLADVKAAMTGSRDYVRARVADKTADEKLAINFDIDNTVLASYYDGGGAIPLMARFSRFLQRQHVAMVFNTGRLGDQRTRSQNQLSGAGYPVAALCLRTKGETLPHGKQRCRDGFIDAGWTLIANVGNNDTDFVGDGYERAFRLPNYGGVLG
jgi:HAD superfamily, subfamily IIIB (Acid phosphatase)